MRKRPGGHACRNLLLAASWLVVSCGDQGLFEHTAEKSPHPRYQLALPSPFTGEVWRLDLQSGEVCRFAVDKDLEKAFEDGVDVAPVKLRGCSTRAGQRSELIQSMTDEELLQVIRSGETPERKAR